MTNRLRTALEEGRGLIALDCGGGALDQPFCPMSAILRRAGKTMKETWTVAQQGGA